MCLKFPENPSQPEIILIKVLENISFRKLMVGFIALGAVGANGLVHGLMFTDLNNNKTTKVCILYTKMFNKYSKISHKERVYFF